jgi:hypothetical protein
LRNGCAKPSFSHFTKGENALGKNRWKRAKSPLPGIGPGLMLVLVSLCLKVSPKAQSYRASPTRIGRYLNGVY